MNKNTGSDNFYKIRKKEIEDDEYIYFDSYNIVEEFYKLDSYIINLDTTILNPDCYRRAYGVIRNAKTSDTIRIVVNSHGGDPDTSVQFFHLLSQCDAHIVCELHRAMSAASDIVLCCDEIELNDLSCMMIHCSSYSTYGKAPDIKKQSEFEYEYEGMVFNKLYSGFLTEEEMELARKGEEFYFMSKDIEKRLKKWIPLKKRG